MGKHRLKDMAAVFIIMFLLPYVITLLVYGFPEQGRKANKGTQKEVLIAYDGRQEKITLTQYLTGLLAAQIPVNYEAETLKAHAIAARTYYYKMDQDKEVIEKETAAQAFLTQNQMKDLWGEQYEENYRKLEAAVTDTGNLCIYYNDELITPYFHAASAGRTRDGREIFGSESYAYLKSCDCEKDLLADNYVTIRTFQRKEIQEQLSQAELFSDASGQAVVQRVEECENPAELFVVTQRDAAGYVTGINAAGQHVHGEEFRNLFQLPSAWFQVEEWEEGIRFVCKGLGHGIGMSLYTANELAKEGKSHEEILGYFYENVKIKEYETKKSDK